MLYIRCRHDVVYPSQSWCSSASISMYAACAIFSRKIHRQINTRANQKVKFRYQVNKREYHSSSSNTRLEIEVGPCPSPSLGTSLPQQGHSHVCSTLGTRVVHDVFLWGSLANLKNFNIFLRLQVIIFVLPKILLCCGPLMRPRFVQYLFPEV